VSCEERPFFFACGGESLLGIVAMPADPAELGVLVIVGGPQYRIGSHRQFVLLARALAVAGIACMRFDQRGTGDSSGAMRSFEAIDDDIRAAVDAFVSRAPGVTRVVLWGLCDAASAACFYAASDPRVVGLVLVNPWVRTDASEASTYLRHYYGRRLLQPEFWRKVGRGEFAPGRAVRSLAALVQRAAGSAEAARTGAELPLPERMASALEGFRGRVLLVLSGKDLTAAEFRDTVARSARWGMALQANPLTTVEVPDADHTFSTARWRREVAEATCSWVREWASDERCHRE
jgi:exosortase A-associated hydrolase 1